MAKKKFIVLFEEQNVPNLEHRITLSYNFNKKQGKDNFDL